MIAHRRRLPQRLDRFTTGLLIIALILYAESFAYE
jgi:23S rRNA-/tRNA-specific pseudouridylate synthase